MLQQPPLPPGVRTLSNIESARLKTRYPDLSPDPHRGCVTCRDKGSYQWYAPGSRTEVVEYQCNCVDQWLLHRFLLNANIGLMYQRLGWEDLTGVEAGARETVSEFLSGLDGFVNAGVGLILYGARGTGKTSLSSLTLKSILSEGYDGYFTTFSEMIDTYTGGWNDRDERAWFHKRIKNTKVLVLDDIGREYQARKSSGLPESTFDEVLRHRVSASTPTIITTNYSMKELQEGYGGGVMSLLRERASTYCFSGEDFREIQRVRTLDEIQSGLTRPIVLQ